MTRVESGRLDFNDEEASIKSCVFAWKKLLDGALTEKNLTFEVDLSGVINDEVFMDKDKCSRSLMGVLNNAVQYTPEGGRIKLTVVQGETNSVGRFRYTFTVEDNGIGISKEFLPSIFEPFSHENNSTDGANVAPGLGITLTKNLIEAGGGSVRVESEKGVGTKVIVNAFLYPVDAEEIGKRDFDEAGLVDAETLLGDMRVMVVDDNEINHMVTSDALENHVMLVKQVPSGEAALEEFKNTPAGRYSLILMDIFMPGMDGFDATRAILALDREDAGNVLIVALSANAHSNDDQKAIEAGMNGFLAKPFELASLARLIAKLKN